MTTITNPVTSTTGTSGTSGSSSSTSTTGTSASQQLAGNFDTFLQLLTTQLQNQDPLSPMDANSFTQELVQFSSVEQQINTNTNLQTMITLQQAQEATSALQLVGSTVTVSGANATLSNATNTPATWSLNSAGTATGNVIITNASGKTVYTGSVALSAGTQTYSWNGTNNSGVTQPDGTYTISVKGTSASGQSVNVTTQVSGTVTGVDTSTSPPQLVVNGQNVAMSAITSIQ
jgi:flagellar basal-body rod modification protein FlgD